MTKYIKACNMSDTLKSVLYRYNAKRIIKQERDESGHLRHKTYFEVEHAKQLFKTRILKGGKEPHIQSAKRNLQEVDRLSNG